MSQRSDIPGRQNTKLFLEASIRTDSENGLFAMAVTNTENAFSTNKENIPSEKLSVWADILEERSSDENLDPFWEEKASNLISKLRAEVLKRNSKEF